jgi:hypothetical protein
VLVSWRCARRFPKRRSFGERKAAEAKARLPSGAPTNVAAVAVSTSQIRVSWNEVATGETGIELQSASLSSGPWSALALLPANATGYTNTGLAPGTQYSYRGRAVFAADISAWSEVATATTISLGGGGYTNLDATLSATDWAAATNPAPPSASAVINFGSATNLTWTWDNPGGTNATLTYTLTRTQTSGPGGGQVFFFGAATFVGAPTNLHLAMDVAKSGNNIGTLRFALRQGTNLFYTSAGLNNVPSTSGSVVTYDLSGLTTLTLKTNGAVALAGLSWTPVYAGTALNFINGLPLEFGIEDDAALGGTATSSSRGAILDNFRVEVGAAGDGTPPVVQITSPTNSQTFLLYAPVTVTANVTDNVAVAEVQFWVDGALVDSLAEAPYETLAPPLALGAHTLSVVGVDESANVASNHLAIHVVQPPCGPLGGVPAFIPGRIEAEHFDVGGEGVAYHDATPANQGGDYRILEGVDIQETQDADSSYNIGWMQNGEWLEYTVNVAGGYHDIHARVASALVSPGGLRVSLNGTVLGTFDVTGTGDGQEWTTLTLPQVPVVGGSNRVLRLEVVSGVAGDQFNLNWVSFAPTPNVPRPVISHALEGGQFIFAWPTVQGWLYQVEYKTNLTQFAWEPWGPAVTAEGSSLRRTNPVAGAVQSYFRVRERP